MREISTPLVLRDFHLGRVSQDTFGNSLVSQNSVKDSLNVNFYDTLGFPIVRKGFTITPNAKASNTLTSAYGVLGMSSDTTMQFVVVLGASNSTLYRYKTSDDTIASSATLNTTSAKARFATLGARFFTTNTTDGMSSSSDGITWANGNSNDCIATGDAKPSLLIRYAGRMLAAGDPTYKDRVFFSSIISPASSPFITWNMNTTTGDWIDVNPDDGGNIVGWALSSTFVLVLKSTGMYRMDTINKNVDPENIFNVGGVSQEAITTCQGTVYFYSAINDIRSTTGGYPLQVSRPVQDILDATDPSVRPNFTMGTDGVNVFLAIGDVNYHTGKSDARTIKNCVLVMSTRDQTWQVMSLNLEKVLGSGISNVIPWFSMWNGSTTKSINGLRPRMAFAGGSGHLGALTTLNYGTTDCENVGGAVLGSPILYEMTTQDIEFGDRSHVNKISDRITVFAKDGAGGKIQVFTDMQSNPIDVPIGLDKRVNVGKEISVTGHFFNIRWFGESTGSAPTFEGVQVETITDIGNS